jgi:hypothetical protein
MAELNSSNSFYVLGLYGFTIHAASPAYMQRSHKFFHLSINRGDKSPSLSQVYVLEPCISVYSKTPLLLKVYAHVIHQALIIVENGQWTDAHIHQKNPTSTPARPRPIPLISFAGLAPAFLVALAPALAPVAVAEPEPAAPYV